MKIYVDCDDVISKTGDMFCRLGREIFNKDIAYEEITDFNIQKSFKLSDEDFKKMMFLAHEPENLGTVDIIEGAAETINSWFDAGHEVNVVTGRPFRTYELTRHWLDEHGLERIKLIHVDKYGVEKEHDEKGVTIDEFKSYKFDFAVEDSPLAFPLLEGIQCGKVAVLNRPWNKSTSLETSRFCRCMDWKDVSALFKKYVENAR